MRVTTRFAPTHANLVTSMIEMDAPLVTVWKIHVKAFHVPQAPNAPSFKILAVMDHLAQ